MVVAEAHVVVVEGEVFGGAFVVVNESFFGRLGFLKAFVSVVILLYVEKTEAEIISSRCLCMPQSCSFPQIFDTLRCLADAPIYNS